MNEQRRIPSPPKRAENTEPLKRDAPRSQDSDNSKPYNGGGANPPTKNDTVTRPKEKRPPASPGKIAEEGRRKPSNDTKDMIPSDHGSSGHEDSAKKARSRREALLNFPSLLAQFYLAIRPLLAVPHGGQLAPEMSQTKDLPHFQEDTFLCVIHAGGWEE
ncbi:unnamed protein product [Cylicostephanus goldi]|uniref:Uncharacterized protein n=1 Tax=Cylicostephanus goldi TaxID=71465 RepID=A0A3P6SZ91_CYLGO|nr:unnamed protein product [Cylicostephanus goldi]